MSILFCTFVVGKERNTLTSTTNVTTNDMNNKRRKAIEEIAEKISQLERELTELASDEQTAHDNLPDSIQESEKGEKMEDNIDEINDIVYELDNLNNRLNELIM